MADFVDLRTEEEFLDFVSAGKKLVFKHSNSCPISYFVKQDVTHINEKIGLIVVQTSRPLSTYVAAETGVRHESPQALVFDNGKCVYSASHYDITSDSIKELLK